MPNNIIEYQSQVPNETPLPNEQASGADFGAQIGQAIEGVGQGMDRFAMAYKDYQDRSTGIDAELSLAKLHQGGSALLTGMENSPDAGSPDFAQKFNDQYQQMYQKAFDALPDNDKARKAFQVGSANLFTGLMDRAIQSQATQGAAIQTQKAQEGLATYVNTIQSDPTQYDTAIKGGNNLIAGLSLPPTDTEKLRTQFRDEAVTGRFDALFRAAKSPQAVAGIVADLQNGDWKNQVSAQKYSDLMRVATAAQKSAQVVANTQAQAAVTSVDDRIKNGVAIDPAEMSSIDSVVKASNSPILIDKWVRLQVQNDTTQRVKGLSSAGLNDYIRQNNGLAAAATPSTTTARIQDGFQYLKQKYGLDDADAVGVLANVGRETGFNPRPGDGGTSDGYFQWHNERMTAAQIAGATGTDLRKAIDFAMSEPEGQAFMAQKGTSRTSGDAARLWMDAFEKPKNPTADQPINEQWASKIAQAVNGGRPPIDIAPGSETTGIGKYPSEFEFIRAQAAQDALKKRDAQVSAGNQILAGQDGGLYTLGQLNTPADFQARAQQSQVATAFTGAKENKPFTSDEVSSFENVMKSGTLDQKMQLMQNISAMGSSAPDAFKQIGEKAPVLSHIGGLSTVSPVVAADVMNGVQMMQDNPDIKADLSAKVTGPGPGGTAAFFTSVAGQALGSMPTDAYAARQAADALYVQRVGTGAPWNADQYTQAVRDVMGAKPGDTTGGVANINGQPTIMPPGVSGDDFQTMIQSLQPQDLLDHSVGGAPPTDAHGRPLAASDLASEGRFRAITAGMYHVYLADGVPAAGSGPGGLYTFKIDAKGVSDILARPREPGLVGSVLNTLETPSFWYHSGGGYGLPDLSGYKSEPTMQQQEQQIESAPPAAPIDLGRGAHVR